jgi:hypothetical protein
MKKTMVVLNEQHTLNSSQIEKLNEKFGASWELLKVPSDGWSLAEQSRIAKSFVNNEEVKNVVFASPVPYLLGNATALSTGHGIANGNRKYDEQVYYPTVHLFHNDNRVKKELPNGRIIMTVADQGW